MKNDLLLPLLLVGAAVLLTAVAAAQLLSDARARKGLFS